MKLVQMEKPAIIKLYEKYSGKKISEPDDFCIEEAQHLKGVYCVGFFAHDRGCMGSEIVVGNSIGTWKELMPKALNLLGWQEASKQQQLVLNWVKDVVLAWEYPMESGNDDFGRADTPEFRAPIAEKIEKGWKISLWVKEPAGMLPQSDYYFFVVEIGKDGTLLSSELGEKFTVQYRGE